MGITKKPFTSIKLRDRVENPLRFDRHYLLAGDARLMGLDVMSGQFFS